MACEICGRYSCTRCFHSLEEQGEFDEHYEKVKDSMKSESNRLKEIKEQLQAEQYILDLIKKDIDQDKDQN